MGIPLISTFQPDITPLDAYEAEAFGSWIMLRSAMEVREMIEREAGMLGFWRSPHHVTSTDILSNDKLTVEMTWMISEKDLAGNAITINDFRKMAASVQRYKYRWLSYGIALRDTRYDVSNKHRCIFITGVFECASWIDYGPEKIYPYVRGNGASPNSRTSPVIGRDE